MMGRWMLCLFLSGSVLPCLGQFSPSASNVLMSDLMSPFSNATTTSDSPLLMISFGLSPCIMACSRPLLESLLQLYRSPDNTSASFSHICEEYEHSLSCMKNASPLDCPPSHLSQALSSGIKFACVDHRQQFDTLSRCLDGRMSPVVDGCSSTCNMTTVVDDFGGVYRSVPEVLNSSNSVDKSAPGEAIKEFSENIDAVCRSASVASPPSFSGTNCVLSCYRERVDVLCPGYGNLYLKSLRLSFEKLGDELGNMNSTSLSDVLDLLLPGSCRELMSPMQLTAADLAPGSAQSDGGIESAVENLLRDELAEAKNLTETMFFDEHGNGAIGKALIYGLLMVLSVVLIL